MKKTATNMIRISVENPRDVSSMPVMTADQTRRKKKVAFMKKFFKA